MFAAACSQRQQKRPLPLGNKRASCCYTAPAPQYPTAACMIKKLPPRSSHFAARHITKSAVHRVLVVHWHAVCECGAWLASVTCLQTNGRVFIPGQHFESKINTDGCLARISTWGGGICVVWKHYLVRVREHVVNVSGSAPLAKQQKQKKHVSKHRETMHTA